ncbi:MAG TPA: efflux transporter outer membrane subunit [Azospira sp.]|nr:efflux transporter outer membrane subunit [Azospira sp.]
MVFHPLRSASWLMLGIATSLAGCAVVGPEYQAPQLSKTDVPGQWTSSTELATKTPATGEERAASRWWSELSDPLLDHLVDEAFRSSPSLEAAMAKLNQSRSAVGQAQAAALPSVDGGAGAQRAVSDASGKGFNQSWLSTNSSWEIDLFGAVRRGKEGALARHAAQQATLADARVSLAADVADAYLSYRACQSYAALSGQDVKSREATERLTAASVKEGFTAPYQAIRSTASVAEAKTQLAATRAYCERLENQLTRLTGIPRPDLMQSLADKPTGLDRLPVPRHFSIAVPREALMQRPDIRAAERNLAAASADIGLAEADRYPRLSLNGSLGYAAEGGSGALSFGTWSFGPSLSLPIFDGGRRKAAVDMAKSRYDEALAEFKARARTAIQEVEDALTRYAAAHERAENARISATQYQRYFDSVELRFREGASNLLELEDARRAMLSAQQTQLGVQQERLQAWIALNRTTGGGAQYEMDSAPAATSGPIPVQADAGKASQAEPLPVH